MADFQVFWAAYPRRVGKGQARRVWDRLKPSEDLLADMLNALAWQQQTDQWKVRIHGVPVYIPHASTWLAGERWLDDKPLQPVTVRYEDWNCGHTPHCLNRRSCQLLMDLAEARERA